MVTDAANVSPGFGAHKPYIGGAHVAVAIHSDPGFLLPTTDPEKPLKWQQEGADQYELGMSLVYRGTRSALSVATS